MKQLVTRLTDLERRHKPGQDVWIGYAGGPWHGPNGERRAVPPAGPDVKIVVIEYVDAPGVNYASDV